jgi:pentatricopeptide repeat protein
VVDSGEVEGTIKQMLKAAQEKKLSAALRRQIEPVDPSAGAAELAKAWQLMNSGRRGEAKTILEAQRKKSPDNADVLNGLGWFYLLGGDLKQAKPLFEKAIKNDAEAAGSYNGLARVLKAEGDTDGAIKLWQEMIEKFPGPNAGTYGLADAYMEKQEFQKAVPLWEQLAKANPNEQQIKDKLARAKEGAK